MPKRKKTRIKPQKPLDTFSKRTGRGRPGVRSSEIVLRAENYRRVFRKTRLDKRKSKWVPDKPHEWAVELVAARTEDDAMHALDSASSYAQKEFTPLVSLILQVSKERAFPRRRETQVDFLADSLAARGDVSPRRSRDICAEERAKQRAKSPHEILRKECYIECSCGYKGPARDNACKKCGAEIPLSLEDIARL